MTRTDILKIAKPILFNTEMVKAIQNGRKTATRRIAKPQPPKDAKGTYEQMDNGNFQLKVAPYESIYDYEIKPKYQVGDLLYVRETWNCLPIPEPLRGTSKTYLYKADGAEAGDKWRPSIHMPKEAARIFLRVTAIRVEQLQDILTEKVDEMFREGIYQDHKLNSFFTCGDGCYNSSPVDCFKRLWNGTVKKSDLDKYGWAADPWVWVICFEKLEVER